MRISRLQVIRYEDFVRAPDEALRPVWQMLELPPRPAGERVRSGVNDRYFDRWSTTRNPLRMLDRRTAARHEQDVRRFGYSVRDLALSGPGMPPAAASRPDSSALPG